MRYTPKIKNHSEWHTWFAWHPVWADDTGQWVWLETVQRRLKTFGYECVWVYVVEINA